MIRLFNIRKLKEEILGGLVSETQLFFYFWILMTFEAVQLGGLMMSPNKVTQYDLIMGWTIIIGNPLGFLLCWLANGGKNGRNFLLHVLPILIVVGIPFAILISVLHRIPFYYAHLNTDFYWISTFYVGNLAMLAVVVYHLRDLAKRDAT